VTEEGNTCVVSSDGTLLRIGIMLLLSGRTDKLWTREIDVSSRKGVYVVFQPRITGFE
jgi:hypothetical protein